MGIKIAVFGEMRAGKNTVATLLGDELREITGVPVTELAFATGIEKLIRYAFPDAYDSGKPRKLLQDLGQGAREIDPMIWINYLLCSNSYRNADTLNQHIIVTDMRQENEYIKLKDQGFLMIKVVASAEAKEERIKQRGDNFSPEMLQHETEASVNKIPYDHVIDNSSTYNDLILKVEDLVGCIAYE